MRTSTSKGDAAEAATVKGKAAKPSAGKANKGKATDPLDAVDAAVSAANVDPSDLTYAAAVMAILALEPEQLSDSHRDYLGEHDHAVVASLEQATALAATTKTERDSLAERTKEATKRLTSATEAQNARTAEIILFTWRTIDRHRLMSADAFCERHGVAKSDVSRWRWTGRTGAKLNVTAPSRLVNLLQGKNRHGPAVEAALASTLKSETPKYEHVAKAITEAKERERTRNRPDAAPVRSVETEAHETAAHLGKLLRQVNVNRSTVADVGQVSGYAVMRELTSYLAAYWRKNGPADMPPVPVPPASYEAPAAKRTPRKAATKRTSKAAAGKAA